MIWTSFCHSSSRTSMTSVLYAQMPAHFLTFDEFRVEMTPAIVWKLSEYPLPFHAISDVTVFVRRILALRSSPQVCGFSMLSFTGIPYVSYVSPQLTSDAAVGIR